MPNATGTATYTAATLNATGTRYKKISGGRKRRRLALSVSYVFWKFSNRSIIMPRSHVCFMVRIRNYLRKFVHKDVNQLQLTFDYDSGFRGENFSNIFSFHTNSNVRKLTDRFPTKVFYNNPSFINSLQ